MKNHHNGWFSIEHGVLSVPVPARAGHIQPSQARAGTCLQPKFLGPWTVKVGNTRTSPKTGSARHGSERRTPTISGNPLELLEEAPHDCLSLFVTHISVGVVRKRCTVMPASTAFIRVTLARKDNRWLAQARMSSWILSKSG